MIINNRLIVLFFSAILVISYATISSAMAESQTQAPHYDNTKSVNGTSPTQANSNRANTTRPSPQTTQQNSSSAPCRRKDECMSLVDEAKTDLTNLPAGAVFSGLTLMSAGGARR